MTETVQLTDDAVAFADRAQAFLDAAPRHTVLASVLRGILGGRFAHPPPRFALVTDDDGAVAGVALRTPPRPLLCSELSPTAAHALLAVWRTVDPEPGGVIADRATAAALDDAWTALTGGRTELRTAMALHEATTIVDPPRPVSGALAPATDADAELVVTWWQAFVGESEPSETDPAETEAGARATVAAGRAYLWVDGGRPVSFVAHAEPAGGVPRIAPVYTPPEHRRRGYAGTAVAAVSRRLLSAGAPRVLLYTDLANATANRIYAEVGYRQILDAEARALLPGG